ncbi:TrbG/VirB9 family P-type conjugative transfer protein [Desertibaculum subflavum]|uniref:TrbG/VirB9 family P-type conjugative transfer protein n=1 Tax=Desertibaculum subflavum TaxID=2268458 RepID=UPI0013C4D054
MIRNLKHATAGLVLAALGAGPAAAQKAADIINLADPAAVEAQLKGEFGGIERRPSLPLGAVQEAWGRADAKAGIYSVAYRSDEIIRLRVREKMPVTIVLPDWEEVGPVANGDPFVFGYQQIQKNMVVVEAAQVGADASLTIVGRLSGRVYAFYLRAEGFNSAEIPDVVVYVKAAAPNGTDVMAARLVALPPTEDMPAAKPAGASTASAPAQPARKSGLNDPDYLQEVPMDPEKLEFGFSMAGDRTIAPERVFSDGVFTYFDFGARWTGTDLPAVWRVVDGVDTPQNTRIRGTMLIAEATGAFTLRNGQRVVCIRPEGWEPTAKPKRPASSTPSTVLAPNAPDAG